MGHAKKTLHCWVESTWPSVVHPPLSNVSVLGRMCISLPHPVNDQVSYLTGYLYCNIILWLGQSYFWCTRSSVYIYSFAKCFVLQLSLESGILCSGFIVIVLLSTLQLLSLGIGGKSSADHCYVGERLQFVITVNEKRDHVNSIIVTDLHVVYS